MSRKKYNYEQFYTKNEIAKQLSNIVKSFNWFKKIERIIVPSAGMGAFSSQFENCIAFDIDPKVKNIIKADFLALEIPYQKNTLVIDNVPFGAQSSLALKFFKKSTLIGDYIAFILPLSFKKQSVQDKLNLNFHIIYENILSENSFYTPIKEHYDIKSVFQIWHKKSYKRQKSPNYANFKDFEFVKKQEADFAIMRVGINAGAIKNNLKEIREASHYFIKCNTNKDKIISKLNSINWKNISDNSVSIRCISKKEIIQQYLI